MNEENESELIRQFKAGDKFAANELFAKYFARVVGAAKRRLEGLRVRATSEDDIAVSVFESLWKRADENRFSDEDLAQPEELWKLMSKMVSFKARDHVRRERAQRRGGGSLRGESVFANANDESPGIAEFAVDEKSLSEIVCFREEHDQMMERLGNDEMREIVTLRLEGHKVKEIAKQFEKSESWVKRKLALIRDTWSEATETTT